MEWDKREQRYSRLNRIFLVVYVVISFCVLWRGVMIGYGRAILYSVVSLVMLAMPLIAEKILKVVFPADSRFFFYLFTFAAVEFGSAMDAYDWIPWWDLFLHGFSGALIAFAGFLFYNGLRHNQGQLPGEEWPVVVIFMNLTATTSAALWEYYEFILDTFFGFNAQYSELGVGDTMTDMMICTAGGLVLSLWIYWSYHHKKQNILLATAEHFYWRNEQGRQTK